MGFTSDLIYKKTEFIFSKSHANMSDDHKYTVFLNYNNTRSVRKMSLEFSPSVGLILKDTSDSILLRDRFRLLDFCDYSDLRSHLIEDPDYDLANIISAKIEIKGIMVLYFPKIMPKINLIEKHISVEKELKILNEWHYLKMPKETAMAATTMAKAFQDVWDFFGI